MPADLCNQKVEEYVKLIRLHWSFVLLVCVLNLVWSAVAVLGNVLVIRALWKARTMPSTLRPLFLSLAVSDLTVGFFAQLMFGVIMAVMLEMAASGNFNFDSFCPNVVTTSQFFLYLLVTASCLSVAAIALDRLLAVSLHLRYQELVTPRRTVLVLSFLWIASGLIASIYIFLPNYNDIVGVFMEVLVLLVTAVAYCQIYKVVRHHQNQIQSQIQNQQAVELARDKRSSFNTFCVYAVLLACYLPDLCCGILVLAVGSEMQFLVAFHASGFLVFLNSSINPLIYYWRYQEIRTLMKGTIRSIFSKSES